jgi:hypothetical protein
MRLPALVIAIGIALVATSCGGDSDDDGATAPVEHRSVPKLSQTIAVTGGSARERSVLESAVAGIEKASVKKIAIGKDDSEAVAITFTTIPAETIRRQWDQWIVAGAFSRRLLAAGLPAQVNAQDSRSAFAARPTVKGEPDPRPLSKAREAAIVKAIRKAAAKADAEVVTLDVYRPHGVAIALTLAPADTVGFLKTQLRPFLEALDAHRPRLEGVYMAALDEKRELALEWGSWTRNPAGVYWVRRDLASCSPIRQSDPPGTPPPPDCPE